MKGIARVMMCATVLLFASAVVGTAAPPQQYALLRPANPPPATTPVGFLGYEIVKMGPDQVAAKGFYYKVVYCPSGKRVVGGGVQSGSSMTRIIDSFPADPTAWVIKGQNDGSVATTMLFYAICIFAP
jgi:hypothetical protein